MMLYRLICGIVGCSVPDAGELALFLTPDPLLEGLGRQGHVLPPWPQA